MNTKSRELGAMTMAPLACDASGLVGTEDSLFEFIFISSVAISRLNDAIIQESLE